MPDWKKHRQVLDAARNADAYSHEMKTALSYVIGYIDTKQRLGRVDFCHDNQYAGFTLAGRITEAHTDEDGVTVITGFELSSVAPKMPTPTKVYEFAGELISRCECGEYIYFVPTDAGKQMPVSIRHHTSHFIDCPKRDRFRKGRK